MQGILILIAVIIGYILRDLRVNQLKQRIESVSKRIKGNKGTLLSWTPPVDETKEAEIELKKRL